MRLRLGLPAAALLMLTGQIGLAASLDDATGRHVAVPDHITRVLPAGEPATALMVVLAPDLMIGWSHHPSAERLAGLPSGLAALPDLPHIDNTAAVKALKPDLILDYGDVDPHYTHAIIAAQAATGVASVLISGSVNDTPRVLRSLGAVLHREARAEMLAKLAETMLPVSPLGGGRTAVALFGPDAAQALVAGGNDSEMLDILGFRLLAPDGKGATFRAVTLAQVAALDPDVIFLLDPNGRAVVQASPQWHGLRAVREGRAWAVPSSPFGWLDGPASVNRLFGLAWLANAGLPAPHFTPMATTLSQVLYGLDPSAPQSAALNDMINNPLR